MMANKLWKELAPLILVIAVSFVFALADKKQYDLQLMFIILTLGILVVYKTILNPCKSDSIISGFADVSSTPSPSSSVGDIQLGMVDAWLGKIGTSPAADKAVSSADYNAVLQSLQDIKTQLKVANTLASQQANGVPVPTMASGLDITTLQTQAAVLTEKLNDLRKRTARTKAATARAVAESVVYPQIPLFSSCVVSDASGGYTAATPTDSAQRQISGAGTAQSSATLQNMISSLSGRNVNVKLTS